MNFSLTWYVITLVSMLMAVQSVVHPGPPRYCVNPDADRVFSKRLGCLDYLLPNATVEELVASPLKFREKLGSTLEYSRMHEIYAYYWFVRSESNPYRVDDCAMAELEYIPLLPMHTVAKTTKPGDVCSYQQLIRDIVNFVDIDQARSGRADLKRFVVASTFNLRSEIAVGLPSQERRGPIYDKVTQFVTNTYIGHYERFHQCPDVLRKGWKGVIEIPYLPLVQLTKGRVRRKEQHASSISSVLFAGRMWLFGPERVCSVRSAIASLASLSAEDQQQERGFKMTVVNMTRDDTIGVTSGSREVFMGAEDHVVNLYGNHSFCVVSKGDSYSSSSLYTAINHLCIPIVISDWFVFAFNWIVPYDKFVIRISEENFLRDPIKAVGDVVKLVTEDRRRLMEMRRHMRIWRRVLRYSVELWDDPSATSMRKQLVTALSPTYKTFDISSSSLGGQTTIIPLELFLVELRYKHLKMTEIDSKENTRRGDSSAHRYLFHGNESLSCNTPFHCPPFAHIVPPFQYHGFERSGLTDLRSPLCQRAHGLIGMYKMVYFMGCVRILWPLRPGYFKPNVERALSLEEKAFVTKFHKIGFSPIVYPPINESNSIVHIESFYN